MIKIPKRKEILRQSVFWISLQEKSVQIDADDCSGCVVEWLSDASFVPILRDGRGFLSMWGSGCGCTKYNFHPLKEKELSLLGFSTLVRQLQ